MRQVFAKMVRGLLGKVGYNVVRFDEVHFLVPMLYRRLRQTGRIVFVQIGANDGRSFDPIHKFMVRHHEAVRGVVIEPMKDFFGRLCETYKDYPNITPVNVAIHNTQKEMKLYRPDPAKLRDLPDYARGIASFNPDLHTLCKTPTSAMIAETVKCMSLGELLDAHKMESLDLLQIDTEGYDAEIIMGIDFARIRPEIIHFEHGLRTGIMTPEVFHKVAGVLHENGYDVALEDFDATAYQIKTFVK